MSLQTLVNRYINAPASRVWADASLSVDEQIERVWAIWQRGAQRIQRETGYTI